MFQQETTRDLNFTERICQGCKNRLTKSTPVLNILLKENSFSHLVWNAKNVETVYSFLGGW